MLGRQARAAWILTFHAACGRMLRREAERLGYRSTFIARSRTLVIKKLVF